MPGMTSTSSPTRSRGARAQVVETDNALGGGICGADEVDRPAPDHDFFLRARQPSQCNA